MPHYLVQATYTLQAWATQPPSAAARHDAVALLFERSGAQLASWYYGCGAYGVVATVKLPAALPLSAFVQTLSASGAFAAVRTIALTAVDEAMSEHTANVSETAAVGMSRTARFAGALTVLLVVGLACGRWYLGGQAPPSTPAARSASLNGQEVGHELALASTRSSAAATVYLVDSAHQAAAVRAQLEDVHATPRSTQLLPRTATVVVVSSPEESEQVENSIALANSLNQASIVLVDLRPAAAP